MARGRKASRRLPRAVKKALEEQQREEHKVEALAPLRRESPVLTRPPAVKRPPLLLGAGAQDRGSSQSGWPQLPASTSTNTEALVPTRSSVRPDELLRSMGQQVLVGQQVSGVCDFWIELKEDFLGGLQIRLSLAQGKVSASLIAKTREAEALLRERLPQLEEQLRKRGMRVAQLEVIVQTS